MVNSKSRKPAGKTKQGGVTIRSAAVKTQKPLPTKKAVPPDSRKGQPKPPGKPSHAKEPEKKLSAAKKPAPAPARSHAIATGTKNVPAEKTVHSTPQENGSRLIHETKNTMAALACLERAIKLLYQKEFKKARSEFKALTLSYQSEPEILARSRTYLQICDREEAAHKKPTITNDQLYSLGVVEFNRGNFEGAVEYFRQSLELHKEADYVFYSMAAAFALQGKNSEAVRALQRAIELNEENRIYGRNDQDFSALHSDVDFCELVGVTMGVLNPNI
jgi:tetratricopeptide (TPR) repeat protein